MYKARLSCWQSYDFSIEGSMKRQDKEKKKLFWQV